MNSQDAVARFRAQESAPTEVRNTKLAAVLSLFGHKPREKDPAIWAIDEQERPHVLWAIPKGDASKTGMSSGQVCRAWETCRGASAKLEALIAKARELTKEAARVPLEPGGKVLSELSQTLEEIESLQYVSQIEAAQRGFEEHQVLMQIIKKLKESGKNQFTMERRGDKTAMFGTGMSEETIAEMKEVAKF